MSDYRAQLRAAVEALAIHPPDRYSWFGRRAPGLTSQARRALEPKLQRAYLQYRLRQHLYTEFYCQGGARAVRPEGAVLPPAGRAEFVQTLSRANAGQGSLSGGWSVAAVLGEQILARGPTLELLARREDCRPQGAALVPGMPIQLLFPKEMLRLSPGFYTAIGDRDLGFDGTRPQALRLYWHVLAEGAPTLLHRLTHSLNAAKLPFRFKVVSDPGGFTRCDAAVLYVDRNDYAAVAPVVEQIYAEVAAVLRPQVPALTRELAPGLGLAEDPGDGDSFGQQRCRLLAEALLLAQDEGLVDLEARMAMVHTAFEQAGLDLDHPYLNPHVADSYAPLTGKTAAASRAGRRGSGDEPGMAGVEALDVARVLGRRVLATAIWQDGRCNWVGVEAAVPSAANGWMAVTRRALGPYVYSGTAGIALFLAELYGATGDEEFRSAALGALRQALSMLETLEPPARLGLYAGWLGVVIAALRVAVLLDSAELAARALHLLPHIFEDDGSEAGYDLLSGIAGSIVALSLLRATTEDGALLERAVALGDRLLGAAVATKAGRSWPAKSAPRQRHLTGFSHGTAGIAYALLELYRMSGEDRFRCAAFDAFRYERFWFDQVSRNWPDFREDTSRGLRRDRHVRFATFWCHGAPGIAIPRLRAYELLHDATSEEEARVALQTTYEMVATALEAQVGSLSLCHGLGGNADILLQAAGLPGVTGSALPEVIGAVGRFGWQESVARGGTWACGTPAAETPNLLLGLSGIGLFYLRLHDPSLPTILAPHTYEDALTPAGRPGDRR